MEIIRTTQKIKLSLSKRFLTATDLIRIRNAVINRLLNGNFFIAFSDSREITACLIIFLFSSLIIS